MNMKIMRNPEVRKSFSAWILLAVIFTAFSTWFDVRFAAAAAVFSFCLIGGFYRTTRRRYERLEEMSLEIDRILHGSSHFDLSRFEEGELAILSSEIYKMTVRLREQADALLKDKTHLADSLADISHQIRTPLTSINLIVDFLSEDDLSRERRLGLTRELMVQLSCIDGLISALLKLSRLDAGAVQMAEEPVSAAELVKKAADTIAIPMELRSQKLVVQIVQDGSFTGDFAWCVEAMGNILKNCMEHTPEGGTITVSVKDNSLFTEFLISDTGDGFSEEDIPHLFDRFYKGKNSDAGSFGIGLALARTIIRAQNGTIQACNGKDGGALFILRFYRTTI